MHTKGQMAAYGTKNVISLPGRAGAGPFCGPRATPVKVCRAVREGSGSDSWAADGELVRGVGLKFWEMQPIYIVGRKNKLS